MKSPTFKKPVKSTGVLNNLPAEQHQKLIGWLNGTQKYREIKALVEKEFGIPLNTVKPLEEFRRNVCVPLLKQRPFCPPHVPPAIWENSLREMEKALQDPNTRIEVRVRVSAFLLQVARLTLEQHKLAAKIRTRRSAKAEPDGQTNPIENADIEDIRSLLFGASAPEDDAQPAAETTTDTVIP